MWAPQFLNILLDVLFLSCRFPCQTTRSKISLARWLWIMAVEREDKHKNVSWSTEPWLALWTWSGHEMLFHVEISSSLNPTEGSYYFRRRTSVSSPARKLEAWSKASRRERSARGLGPDADKDLSPVRLPPGLILSTQAKKKSRPSADYEGSQVTLYRSYLLSLYRTSFISKTFFFNDNRTETDVSVWFSAFD